MSTVKFLENDALEAVAKRFELQRDEPSSRAFVTSSGVQLSWVVKCIDGASRSAVRSVVRLREARVALNVLGELEQSLSPAVPAGKTLIFTVLF